MRTTTNVGNSGLSLQEATHALSDFSGGRRRWGWGQTFQSQVKIKHQQIDARSVPVSKEALSYPTICTMGNSTLILSRYTVTVIVVQCSCILYSYLHLHRERIQILSRSFSSLQLSPALPSF